MTKFIHLSSPLHESSRNKSNGEQNQKEQVTKSAFAIYMVLLESFCRNSSLARWPLWTVSQPHRMFENGSFSIFLRLLPLASVGPSLRVAADQFQWFSRNSVLRCPWTSALSWNATSSACWRTISIYLKTWFSLSILHPICSHCEGQGATSNIPNLPEGVLPWFKSRALNPKTKETAKRWQRSSFQVRHLCCHWIHHREVSLWWLVRWCPLAAAVWNNECHHLHMQWDPHSNSPRCDQGRVPATSPLRLHQFRYLQNSVIPPRRFPHSSWCSWLQTPPRRCPSSTLAEGLRGCPKCAPSGCGHAHLWHPPGPRSPDVSRCNRRWWYRSPVPPPPRLGRWNGRRNQCGRQWCPSQWSHQSKSLSQCPRWCKVRLPHWPQSIQGCGWGWSPSCEWWWRYLLHPPPLNHLPSPVWTSHRWRRSKLPRRLPPWHHWCGPASFPSHWNWSPRKTKELKAMHGSRAAHRSQRSGCSCRNHCKKKCSWCPASTSRPPEFGSQNEWEGKASVKTVQNELLTTRQSQFGISSNFKNQSSVGIALYAYRIPVLSCTILQSYYLCVSKILLWYMIYIYIYIYRYKLFWSFEYDSCS